MSKMSSRMLAVLFTASFSFGAFAGQSNQGVSDDARAKLAQAEQQRGVTDGQPSGGTSGSNATPTRDSGAGSATGKSGYSTQRGVTDGSPSGSRADAQAEYKAAVANCNNQSGKAKTACMKKAAKHRDKTMSSMKTGTKGETGVSGRSGTSAGTNNNDSAPIGEKPSNPTSQGSSALDRENKNAGGSSSRTGKTGVSGRAGTGAGTNNNDSAPVGEKSSDPTSQGSSADSKRK